MASNSSVEENCRLRSSSEVVTQTVAASGDQRGGQEDQDQPVAKPVHPFRAPRPGVRTRSERRNVPL